MSQMLRSSSYIRCLLGSSKQQAVLFGVKRWSTAAAAQRAIPQEWDNAKPYEDMPGPKPLPILGNAWRFIPKIGNLSGFGFIELGQYLQKHYGDIAKLSGIPGRTDMVMVFDPDDIEKVFRNEGPWPIRETVECFVYYRSVTRKDIFQGVGGLVTVQGEEWQKFRSKVNQIMMQPRATKLYIGPIDSVADDFVERIRALRDEKLEMPSDFNNEMYKWGLESIAYIALDTRLGCFNPDLKPDSEPQKMIDAVQIMFDAMYKMEIQVPFWKIMSTPAWRALVNSADYFVDVSLKYIKQAMERLKNLPPDSDRELTVLEKLLAKDPDIRTTVVMALDMLGAGIDTTSYTAVVVMYMLSKNQDKQEKLFQEVQRVLPNKKEPITAEKLNEMKYLRACIKETMRISPITGGNQRNLSKDLVLGNYRVPKGTSIMMPGLLLSRMDKHFPQANKFIPERWLKDEPESKMKLHSFVTLPFGFGPRTCIGRRFAELEIETLLAKVVRNFRIEYNYGDMKFVSKLLYTPSSPLKFKMIDREN
ncbi:probable cytochrome P450 301a1, mitochondrial [Periplaneta americana]|uniref:probable cytochrome P450 301a1, mitochondrial n=1 Tax=Periplaneta americana TaxID=6978 RepID=UPI0037E726F0